MRQIVLSSPRVDQARGGSHRLQAVFLRGMRQVLFAHGQAKSPRANASVQKHLSQSQMRSLLVEFQNRARVTETQALVQTRYKGHRRPLPGGDREVGGNGRRGRRKRTIRRGRVAAGRQGFQGYADETGEESGDIAVAD